MRHLRPTLPQALHLELVASDTPFFFPPPCMQFHHPKNVGNFGAPFFDVMFQTQDHWLAAGGLKGMFQLKEQLETAKTKKS